MGIFTGIADDGGGLPASGAVVDTSTAFDEFLSLGDRTAAISIVQTGGASVTTACIDGTVTSGIWYFQNYGVGDSLEFTFQWAVRLTAVRVYMQTTDAHGSVKWQYHDGANWVDAGSAMAFTPDQTGTLYGSPGLDFFEFTEATAFSAITTAITATRWRMVWTAGNSSHTPYGLEFTFKISPTGVPVVEE